MASQMAETKAEKTVQSKVERLVGMRDCCWVVSMAEMKAEHWAELLEKKKGERTEHRSALQMVD